jgi:hemerythrin-like metal-binding protein
MEYVVWIPEKYSVNIAHFDEQHQKLLAIMNEVFQAIVNKSNKKAIVKIIAELNGYATLHFADEEAFMKEKNHPDLPIQEHAHAYFIQKVQEFMKEIHQENEELNREILGFLKDWLLRHIIEVDRRYRE